MNDHNVAPSTAPTLPCVLIGTPAYGGMVHTDYVDSLLQYATAHVPFAVMTIGNESLITRARNAIAAPQNEPALSSSVESLAHLSNRFAKFLSNADTDTVALNEEAAELTLRCEPWLNSGPGLAPSCDMIMWSALALLARMPAVSDEVRAQYETRIEQHHQMLRTWAGYCAANYLHRERLVAAERARIAGKTAEAILLYDEAIDAAQRNGYPLHEILAHELAGRFYASINRSKLASFFLTEAFYAYLRIGTTLKSSALLDEFPEMLRAETRTLKDLARPDRPTRVTTSSVSSNTSTDHHFDVNAVLRAAEVIELHEEAEARGEERNADDREDRRDRLRPGWDSEGRQTALRKPGALRRRRSAGRRGEPVPGGGPGGGLRVPLLGAAGPAAEAEPGGELAGGAAPPDRVWQLEDAVGPGEGSRISGKRARRRD